VDIRSYFGRKQDALIGLDISSWGIKVVALSGSLDSPAVETMDSVYLPPGYVVEGNIVKMAEVSQALQILLQKNKIKAKKAALALHSSSVITKKIMVRADLRPQEMEMQVEEEARQYIPFPLEEVSLDFYNIGPNPQREDMVDVIIAAARRERVQAAQELAETVGLEATVVDVQSYSLRLALKRVSDIHLPGQDNALVMLIKVGANRTLIQLAVGDEIVYERDQSIGGNLLTQRIASHYGISVAQAEDKKVSGNQDPDFAAVLLKSYKENVTMMLDRGMQFLYNSTPYSTVNHIFLAGGGAMVPGLPEAISTVLHTPCSLINPFEGMRIDPQIRRNIKLQDAPLFLSACGLALRQFTL